MLETPKHTLFQEYVVLLYETYLMTGIKYVRTFSTYLLTGIRCVSLCNIPYVGNNVCNKLLNQLYYRNKVLVYVTYPMTGKTYVRNSRTHLKPGISCVTLCKIAYTKHNVCQQLQME